MVEYLKTPPTAATLKGIVKMLGIPAADLLRKKEKALQGLQIDLGSDKQVIEAMAKEPVLMERPVVVRGKRAVLGRPPENVKKLM